MLDREGNLASVLMDLGRNDEADLYYKRVIENVDKVYEPGHPLLAEAQRLMLCAETSCYWYWTGQHVWDQQVTNAANLGWSRIRPSIDSA